MKKAIEEGTELPDITIGIRGGDDVVKFGNDVAIVDADCYIIDGLQRWTATCLAAQDHPDLRVVLGIKGYTNSDVTFERLMFRKMNTNHTAMAASVILRNEKEDSRVAATLYGVSVNEPSFALHRHVAWEQEADKTLGAHYIRGAGLLRILATLHAHLMTGVKTAGTSQTLSLLAVCDRRIDGVGLPIARKNLIEFFDVIDEVWGIRDTPIKFGIIYMLEPWLIQVSRILSNHREFWRGSELFVTKDWIRDLGKVNPNDPDLIQLTRGNHVQHEILYATMLNLINKGKSTGRLVNRYDLEKAEAAADQSRYYGGRSAAYP
jgi:hypothetical protein